MLNIVVKEPNGKNICQRYRENMRDKILFCERDTGEGGVGRGRGGRCQRDMKGYGGREGGSAEAWRDTYFMDGPLRTVYDTRLR